MRQRFHFPSFSPHSFYGCVKIKLTEKEKKEEKKKKNKCEVGIFLLFISFEGKEGKATTKSSLTNSKMDDPPSLSLFPLFYENANEKIEGEQKSKLLANDSALYAKLEEIHQEIRKRFPSCGGKRMDFHTELTRSGRPEELIQRAQFLHGTLVDLSARE